MNVDEVRRGVLVGCGLVIAALVFASAAIWAVNSRNAASCPGSADLVNAFDLCYGSRDEKSCSLIEKSSSQCIEGRLNELLNSQPAPQPPPEIIYWIET